MIDPKIAIIFLDSCAFDPKYSPEDEASRRLHEFSQKGKLIVNIVHSTQKEIEHPNTPSCVKRQANNFSYTKETYLEDTDRKRKAQIVKILAGNGNPGRVAKDAEHIFEADKYGDYFITTDNRILKKKEELKRICSLNISKPSQLLEIMTVYENT